ncbi:hypothetical protein GQ44DRAFT_716697 [Phaeosphaeriaceae sp. PMI808]|nr:hypothetical protein GQ44DRAFT_716697 [Phaeosphaeriaceae sp. PMI808]
MCAIQYPVPSCVTINILHSIEPPVSHCADRFERKGLNLCLAFSGTHLSLVTSASSRLAIGRSSLLGLFLLGRLLLLLLVASLWAARLPSLGFGIAFPIICLCLLGGRLVLVGFSVIGIINRTLFGFALRAGLGVIILFSASLGRIRLVRRLVFVFLCDFLRLLLGINFRFIILGLAILFAVILLLGRGRVFHLIVFVLRLCRLFFLLRLVVLGITIGLMTIGALDFFVNLELASTLDDVVSRPLDMHSQVVLRSVLLDGVAALRLDGDSALIFDLGNRTTRLAATPVPRNFVALLNLGFGHVARLPLSNSRRSKDDVMACRQAMML